MHTPQKISIFWFRRDLRLSDNAGLYHALKSSPFPVLPLFIFDKNILSQLTPDDARVTFIYNEIIALKNELHQKYQSDIEIIYSTPVDAYKTLLEKYDVQSVFSNRDYEPYAADRDSTLTTLLAELGIPLKTYKDQVIFEYNEVLKDDGKPYTVYTPYSKKWKNNLTDFHLKPYPTEQYAHNFLKVDEQTPIPNLKDMGFTGFSLHIPPKEVALEVLKQYGEKRNFPGVIGTSRLGIHLRFGTISIRSLATIAKNTDQTFLNELIWRDFYQAILYHFPHSATKSFKKEYDFIEWENNPIYFEKWCNGQTGYPIVDAGMRELNTTGYMHNRVRMIVASFLCKHLLIDWRFGERYFAQKLLDYDLAANTGGWQWAAGSGCDAAPYFRIFNPYLQTEKFDKNFTYIKQFVPELNTDAYPKPIVIHDQARKKALEVYGKALKK